MPSSWWLKYRRAVEHFEEAEKRMSALGKLPERFEVEPTQFSAEDPRWHYSLVLPNPDEMLPLVVGDLLTNARAALDHIYWALAPEAARNTRLHFPILTKDPHRLDSHGRLVDASAPKKKWVTSTRWLSKPVLDIVTKAQPYLGTPNGDESEFNALSVLANFVNRDKHRELNIVVTGISGLGLILHDGQNESSVAQAPADTMAPDGATIFRSVEHVRLFARGVLTFAIQHDGPHQYHEAPEVLRNVLKETWAVLSEIHKVAYPQDLTEIAVRPR